MQVCAHDMDIREEGRIEGKMHAFFDLVSSGIISIDVAAEKAEMSVDEFAAKYNDFQKAQKSPKEH